MAGNRSIEDKYHMLVVQSRDLIARLEESKEINKRLEEDKHTVNQLIKSFCEMILLNNSDKKTKGEEESWDSLTIEKLISEATKSYRSYQQNNFQQFSKLMSLIEKRTAEIDKLEQEVKELNDRQIAEQARSQGITDPEEIKRLQEECERLQKEKKEKEEQEKQEKIIQREREEKMNKLSDKLKARIRNSPSNIDFDTSDDDDIYVEDEGNDIPNEEIQLREHAKNVADISSFKKPVRNRSKTFVEKGKKSKQKTSNEKTALYNVEDLGETIEQIDEYGWCALEIIGKKGHSLFTVIEQEVMQIKNCSKNKPRTACKYLSASNVLVNIPLSTPKGKCILYILSDKGKRIYEEHFKEKPVISHAEKIKKEHTSYEHGYGIYFLSQVFKDNSNVNSVKIMNRKNPIIVSSSISYIPDIILLNKKEDKMYMEYELNTHTQTEFNSKCRKMYAVNKVMNFIIPSKEEMDSFTNKIQKWIHQSKNAIPGAIIRINTFKGIDSSSDYWKDENWSVIYDVDKSGDVPVMRN